MPDMKKKYNEEVRSALQAKLGLKNVMQIPKLEKIVISTGIGSDAERDAFTEAKKHLAAMTGQQPVITKARKNVSNFKLRVGMPVGVMVTLRGNRMYEFLDRFVHNAMPRVRDFPRDSEDRFRRRRQLQPRCERRVGLHRSRCRQAEISARCEPDVRHDCEKRRCGA